jgi:prepilin-type processing-associated H-X9-DG protein
MKQVGIGLHNFHDVYKTLPSGCQSGLPGASSGGGLPTGSGTIRLSGQVWLLPFIEQVPRWSSCLTAINDIVTQNPQSIAATATDAQKTMWKTAWHEHVPTYLCPSDGNHNTDWGDLSPGRNNVMFSVGDFPTSFGTGLVYRGVFHIGIVKLCAFEDVTDGLSNTIFISESAISDGSSASNNTGVIRGDIRKNIGTTVFGGSNGWENTTFSACHATAPDRRNYLTSSGNIRRDLTGKMWGKGYFGTTMFHTILPPNSASCFGGSSPADSNTMLRMAQTATSNHSGGVNVGLGDGSVKFITDTIDIGNLDAGSVTSGSSPYGIWGAMGSKDGGETKTP